VRKERRIAVWTYFVLYSFASDNFLRGIRRTIGTARAGKAPATADLIGQMVALCPTT
jgi:hypothetical protein